MPHGALTPLGRQLRSVLTSLQSAARWHASSEETPLFTIDLDNRRSLNPRIEVRRQHAYALAPEERAIEDDTRTATDPPFRSQASPRRARGLRVDYFTGALKQIGKVELLPASRPGKHDLSYKNIKIRSHATRHQKSSQRLAPSIPESIRPIELSLQQVIASYIRHEAAVRDTGRASWDMPFELARDEKEFLASNGYTLDDIEAYAQIITAEDSTAAADLLLARTSGNVHAVPFQVFTYLLRRGYLSSYAVEVLLNYAHTLFESRRQVDAYSQDTKSLFVVFLRLLRHVRKVSFGRIDSVVSLLLGNLRGGRKDKQEGINANLVDLTYILNKAMRLVALPHASHPIKASVYQEHAILRILRFMAEHKPAIQINREGYRAVISAQLARPKTPRERKWAQLKALSWPPWKEDRTAMDAEITAESHGISRAGQTLRRMQEAGYGKRRWEEAAELYAGWDSDGTPTIQTRIQLRMSGEPLHSGAGIWVARIKTTRTLQEAWACYLAYEDAKLLPSQDVLLAMCEKLHQEQRRQWREQNNKDDHTDTEHDKPRLYPGDTKEIQPLPPSTHLYTYNRTPPPTLSDFVGQLQDRGIVFEGAFLAFVVAKASLLQTGVELLKRAVKRYPAIENMLYLRQPLQLDEVPMPVFAAYVELLCRFSNVPISRMLGELSHHDRNLTGSLSPIHRQHLNIRHPIVCAIWLLQCRKPTFIPPWHSILRALAHTASFETIHLTYKSDSSWHQPFADEPSEPDEAHGAVIAFWLMRRVQAVMQDLHLDQDAVRLHCYALAIENLAHGCWKLLRLDRLGQTASMSGKMHVWTNTLGALGYLRGRGRVMAELKSSVGGKSAASVDIKDVGVAAASTGVLKPSDLLYVPNAATLHALIRALGWLAEYDELRALVRWMVEHETQLAVQRTQDRNGKFLTRRAIVATRVFLERGWFVAQDPDGEERRSNKHAPDRKAAQLQALERAATPDHIADVQEIVESVEEWGGWPSDEEVEVYCEDQKFDKIRQLYQQKS